MSTMEHNTDISLMTSEQYAKAVVKSRGILLLPLSSLEVLGSHGPLGADTIIASHATHRIAQRTKALYAPTIPYGDTLELPHLPGTIHIPTKILEEFYLAIARSLFHSSQLKYLFFMSFHSLNNHAANAACRILTSEGHRVFLVDWWKTASRCCSDLLADATYGTSHGGEMATSMLLYLAPETIHGNQATTTLPKKHIDFYTSHMINSGTPFTAYSNFSDYCEGSSWGNIAGASSEKGKLMLKRTITEISAFIHAATDLP